MAGYYERTPEQRKKHSEACKGRTGLWRRTKKHNEAMSFATKGKVFSGEHKENLRSALIRRWRAGDLNARFAEGIQKQKEKRERLSKIPVRKRLSRPLDRNGNWKGGVTPENTRARFCLEYRTWRDAVFTRDKHTCFLCKQRGVYLEAHHIKTFSEHPELRYEPANGITLCRPCHQKTKRREKEYEVEFINAISNSRT